MKYEDPETEAYRDYTIWEEHMMQSAGGAMDSSSDESSIDPTLRIDLNNIHIHEIKAVSFVKDENQVHRSVSNKKDTIFDEKIIFGER
jgi:hypothetical protein